MCYACSMSSGVFMKKSSRSFGVAAGFLLARALATFVVPAVAQTVAAAEAGMTPVDSLPAESNGVALVIGASRNSFAADEPLEFHIMFQNTTDRAIWVTPAGWGYWVLHAKNEAGMISTGVTTLIGGVTGPPQPPPVRLQPHEKQTSVVTFRNFGFVHGDLGQDEARAAMFRMSKDVRADAAMLARFFTLAPGVYQLTVEVRIPDDYRQAIITTLANAPLCRKQAADIKGDDYEFHDDECRIRDLPEDFDPASLWKSTVLRSHPVQISIAALK